MKISNADGMVIDEPQTRETVSKEAVKPAVETRSDASKAATNSAEASSSFSPPVLWKRLVERIQISSGTLKMRVSVMELGRFTAGTSRRRAKRMRPATRLDYPPPGRAKAMEEEGSQRAVSGEGFGFFFLLTMFFLPMGAV